MEAEPPTSVDTLYHPIHEGRQVIEVDHEGFRERTVRYREVHSPISSSWNFLVPMSPPNELLVRDATGSIVAAYNTTDDLDEVRRKWQGKLRPSNFINQVSYFDHSESNILNFLLMRQGMYGPFEGRIPSYHRIYQPQELSPSGRILRSVHETRAERLNLKMGLIDSAGKVVLPIEYNSILAIGSRILVEKEGKCVLLDHQLKQIIPLSFDRYSFELYAQLQLYIGDRIRYMVDANGRIHDFGLGYDHMDFRGLAALNWDSTMRNRQFLVVRNGKAGLIDADYHEVLPPKYDFIYPSFSDGLSRVVRANRWGFIDSQGQEVIPCQFEDALDFRDGKAYVVRDGAAYWIDRQGERMRAPASVPIPWSSAGDFWVYDAKMSCRIVWRESRYGVVDGKGKILLPVIYEEIQQVVEDNFNRKPMPGIFKVRMHGKYGIMDRAGNELLPVVFDQIGEFLMGYGQTTVTRGKFSGLINRDWKLVLPAEYESVYPFFGQRLIQIAQSGKQGLVDSLGRTVVPLAYEQIWPPQGRVARVMRDSLFGIVSLDGGELIPVRQQDVHDRFIGGLTGVKQDGKWGFMDSTAKWVIAPQFEDVGGFFKKIAPVKMGGKYGFVDRAGKPVTEFMYDRMRYEWEMDGLMEVWRDGKVGFVNENGKEVIACIYDEVNASSIERGHHLLKEGTWRWVKK